MSKEIDRLKEMKIQNKRKKEIIFDKKGALKK